MNIIKHGNMWTKYDCKDCGCEWEELAHNTYDGLCPECGSIIVYEHPKSNKPIEQEN